MGRPRAVYTPVETGPTPEAIAEEALADGVLGVAAAAKFCAHARSWMFDVLAKGEIPSFILGGKRVVAKKLLVAYLVKASLADEGSQQHTTRPTRLGLEGTR